jgi:drug/metabolite transporter (DMT)-like permease
MMVATTLIFGAQDALSRHLAESANVMTVVLIRYVFFALFVIAMAMAAPGGLMRAARTRRPWLQWGRGVLLAAEVCLIVWCFTLVGLAETHALLAAAPLLVVALAGPVLGERVTPRRWAAIALGLAGVLIILRPGAGVFGAASALVLLGALMYATYSLLTRLAARADPPMTSFFYTGVGGAALMLLVGPFHWQPPQGADWIWMGLLCLSGAGGHYLLIRALALADASRLQPLAYLQLVFATGLGVLVFNETLRLTTVLGAVLVVGAGLLALRAERPSA